MAMPAWKADEDLRFPHVVQFCEKADDGVQGGNAIVESHEAHIAHVFDFEAIHQFVEKRRPALPASRCIFAVIA